MTRDELHKLFLSWQPKWFQRWYYPIRELLAGLFLLPALLWIPIHPLLSLSGFLTVSGAYECFLSGPKISDAMWRGIGAALVYVGWTVVT